MGYVMLWVACAVVGAAMLSRYNAAGTGCLLGGLLGPIGLLIALVMRVVKADAGPSVAAQVEAAVAKALEAERRERELDRTLGL